MSLMLGNGDGTVRGEKILVDPGQQALQGRLIFAAGTDPAALAIGDLNNDGKPDIVVAKQKIKVSR